MSKYVGKPVQVARPIEEIYAKVSDLGQYRQMVEQLPDEVKAQLQGVKLSDDSISMDAPGVGALEFKITDRRPHDKVELTAVSSPVPLKILLELAADSAGQTTVSPAIDIQIPAMLRPFIGNKIQEAADRFGEIFTTLFK